MRWKAHPQPLTFRFSFVVNDTLAPLRRGLFFAEAADHVGLFQWCPADLGAVRPDDSRAGAGRAGPLRGSITS